MIQANLVYEVLGKHKLSRAKITHRHNDKNNEMIEMLQMIDKDVSLAIIK